MNELERLADPPAGATPAWPESPARTLAIEFIRHMLASGYQGRPSVRASASDASVTFLNATVTPHKTKMVSGDVLIPMVQHQVCLRENGDDPMLIAFNMVGTLESTDSHAGLEASVGRLHNGILAAVSGEIEPRVPVLVDERDGDLSAALQKAANTGRGEVHVVAGSTVGTRWRYGEGEALRGRGATYLLPTGRGHPDCEPGCDCGSWLGFANVIVVESANGRYLESGFGCEVAAAGLLENGDLYALPEISQICTLARRLGVTGAFAERRFANLYRAIAAIGKLGVSIGGSRQGSVLRRLVDECSEILPSQGAPRLRHEFSEEPDGGVVLDLLRKRVRLRFDTWAGKTRRIARHLDRNPEVADSELHSTFGAEALQIRDARRRDKIPPALTRTSRVALVTPSDPVLVDIPSRSERAIIEFKRTLGMDLELGHTPKHGSRHARADALNGAFKDDRVDAILWGIGGTSASQILDLIDYDAIAARPKVMIGYSDATVVAHAIYAVTGCTTFYGPALVPQFGEAEGIHEFTLDSFVSVLLDGWTGSYGRCETVQEEFLDWREFPDVPRERSSAPPRRILRDGTSEGPMLAGCLPSVCQLIGTPYMPAYEGHILALDIPDGHYSVRQAARDLWHLRDAGLLRDLAGLCVGRPRLWGPSDREALAGALMEAIDGSGYPVVTELEFGHTDPMITIPIGVSAAIDSDDLILLSAGVRRGGGS